MRRRGFPLFGNRAAQAEPPPALRQAHALLAARRYEEAAQAFENLAAQNPLRAPSLYQQASRARLLQGQTAAAMQLLKQSLHLLKQSGRYAQLYRAGQRATQELKLRGLPAEAAEIAAILSSNLPAIAEMPTERGPDLGRVSLPTTCPSCGGPLRPAEVDWVDPITAECAYYGSLIRAEQR
jgi:tetratricopeptide (TPR) repeat protein